MRSLTLIRTNNYCRYVPESYHSPCSNLTVDSDGGRERERQGEKGLENRFDDENKNEMSKYRK